MVLHSMNSATQPGGQSSSPWPWRFIALTRSFSAGVPYRHRGDDAGVSHQSCDDGPVEVRRRFMPNVWRSMWGCSPST